MKLQTKDQKQAEISYRRKALEQRLGIKNFNHSYKFGEKEFYINNWVVPQIARFKKILAGVQQRKLEDVNTLEIGAESGHLSAYLANHFSTNISIASDIADSLIEANSLVTSYLQFKRSPKVVFWIIIFCLLGIEVSILSLVLAYCIISLIRMQ
jgi:hypothetical protein